jgi:hypothetical protein
MFIAALFTIAKLWKQSRYPTTDEWIKKMWYLYAMEFYSATNFVIFRQMDGTGEDHLKWRQLGSEGQKPHVFSHMWKIDLKQIQQHEKQVMLKGGHTWEEEGKQRKLRRWIQLMYSLYKKEYRIFKLVEAIIKKCTKLERRKREEMNQFEL